MKLTLASVAGLLLSVASCKPAKIIGLPTKCWRSVVGRAPGVTFELVVVGDDDDQPLIVLLHRYERSATGPDPKIWKEEMVDRRGVHEFSVQGKVISYRGWPVFVAASGKDGVYQIREGVVPSDWVDRVRIQAMFTDGHPNWTLAEYEKFWKDRAEPMFSPPPKEH
jgi:hypothetical protein